MPRTVLALLAMTFGAAAAAPSPAQTPDSCTPPDGERVLARSPETVITVAKRVTGKDPLGGAASESTWYACRRATGERIELERGHARWKQFRDAGTFRLAGPYVAYVFSDADYVVSWEMVVLRDLRVGEPLAPADTEERFGALALHDSGALAWVRHTYGRPWKRLEARTAEGAIRILDRSRFSRVRFTPDGTLHWRKRGRKRSAALG
jgi:hypothetical protein